MYSIFIFAVSLAYRRKVGGGLIQLNVSLRHLSHETASPMIFWGYIMFRKFWSIYQDIPTIRKSRHIGDAETLTSRSSRVLISGRRHLPLSTSHHLLSAM